MFSLFVIVMFDGIFIGPYTPRNKVWSYEGPEIEKILLFDGYTLIFFSRKMYPLGVTVEITAGN